MSIGTSAAYDIRFEQRDDDYLYARVSGDGTSPEVCRRYFSDVAAECRARGCYKVLVDSHLEGQISVTEMFRITCELPELGFHGIKMALAEYDPGQHDRNTFGETAASNRGLMLRVFLNVQDAEQWLLSPSS